MPETLALAPLLPWLDAFAIAMFAASGAIAAARAQQTFVTAAFFALVTGVGGGTVRDLLIGAPVFWVRDPIVASLCLAAAVLIWVTPERWWAGKGLDWLDAIGLSAYAVFGAAKATGFGTPPVPAILMGVITACAGGIIRDMMAGEPSILMRPELYVTAAALASALWVGLRMVGLEGWPVALIASGAGFALRGAAIRYKLRLPSYRASR